MKTLNLNIEIKGKTRADLFATIDTVFKLIQDDNCKVNHCGGLCQLTEDKWWFHYDIVDNEATNNN